MGDNIIIPIAFFATVMTIAIFGMITRTISKRAASHKEVAEIREDISQIKERIEEMREQLADIVIRLG